MHFAGEKSGIKRKSLFTALGYRKYPVEIFLKYSGVTPEIIFGLRRIAFIINTQFLHISIFYSTFAYLYFLFN